LKQCTTLFYSGTLKTAIEENDREIQSLKRDNAKLKQDLEKSKKQLKEMQTAKDGDSAKLAELEGKLSLETKNNAMLRKVSTRYRDDLEVVYISFECCR